MSGGYGKKARDLHKKGYNCAQCVLMALDDKTGLDDKTASSIAAAFGGGMRTGEVCGALSGSLMALGLNVAKDGNGAASAPVTAPGKSIQKKFKKKYGTERCAELIASNNGKKRCDEFISYCARLTASEIERIEKSDAENKQN